MELSSIRDNLLSNLIWVAVVAIAGIVYKFYSSLNNLQWILLIIDGILIAIFFYHKYKFQSIIGIYRVDSSMEKGITPDKALRLCKNNMRFLGVAATKLIENPKFEETIKRCNRPGQPIKFLLSAPDNPILRHAAARAKRDITEFQNKVRYTLNKLQELKKEHGYNIEVRLYKSEKESGPPSFRLIFIDNTSVLVSYYIFGEGDGTQMPQVQIVKPKNERDNGNFYYAFEHYFNSLWETSTVYEL